jgi:hypothetical protein
MAQETNLGGIIFSYSGDIDQKTTGGIIDKIEEVVVSTPQLFPLKKRILAISIEVLQNLYHHTLRPSDTKSMFEIILDGNNCFLVASNGVNAEMVESLQKSIEHINAMSDEELKKYYMEKLNNQQYSEKGGGGLGLISIARKSGTKLDYTFNAVNDKQFNFVLTTKLAL